MCLVVFGCLPGVSTLGGVPFSCKFAGELCSLEGLNMLAKFLRSCSLCTLRSRRDAFGC